jgi:RimJ/RimL family protein N-acetyltransferase
MAAQVENESPPAPAGVLGEGRIPRVAHTIEERPEDESCRRGYAAEAGKALIQWAAETHAVQSFLLSMGPTNHASIGVARPQAPAISMPWFWGSS